MDQRASGRAKQIKIGKGEMYLRVDRVLFKEMRCLGQMWKGSGTDLER